ncbi:hypothetical protein A3SI_06324 [Nitritalea halalkaliphila LW7]|uniref:MerC domain-containing protein n=1 Tax=Nitritalea halalkaliphila LW7 TaxID=1189621 RepID=I5C6V3_9BACT|nr:MerC domain-containing protein [Nitritalea halalkaliphila]EIM77555.1 hypothetical protein A3SI_06324 [Nitritalea halalkaliphila LW7]
MLHLIKRRLRRLADLIGLSASVLCMLHCLLVPVVWSTGYWLKSTEGLTFSAPKAAISEQDPSLSTEGTIRHYGLKYQKIMAENHVDHPHTQAGSPADHRHSHGKGGRLWHMLDYFFVAIALLAVYESSQKMASKRIKILLWTAVSVFGASILLHEVYPALLYLSLSASAFLVYGHYLGWKAGRASAEKHT